MRRITYMAMGCAAVLSSGACRDAAEPPPSVPDVTPIDTSPAPSPDEPPPGPGPGPGEGPGGPGAEDTPTFEGTAGILEKKREGVKPAVLRDVRAARHERFDRVVFEFAGDELPGYHTEYVDKPVRRCGSGLPTEIAGQGWLAVRLQPAQAHDDAGKATVTDRERKTKLGVLQELELTCDFEAQVQWVLGVSSPNRYRVLELSKPARLVVDVKH